MRAPGCGGCDTGVDHCHGTLIVHVDWSAECTEPDCVDIDRARHTFVVDCADVAGGCVCGGGRTQRYSA